jgi:ABC-2 type transport system permease protein
LSTTSIAVSINLLRRLFNRHGAFLTVIGLILAGFQVLICAIVSNTDIEGVLSEFSRSLPSFFQAVVGEELAGMTSRGLLAFAWNHPVVHALFAAVMMLLASRAIAAEVEAGTLELLLSQPISRPVYLGTQIVFTSAVLTALAGLTLLGIYLGLSAFDLRRVLPWQAFLPVAANLIGLELSIYGVTLFLSSTLPESGRVVTRALLFVLVAYLIQAVARLWPAIQFLQTVTVFEYYSPQRIVLNNLLPWRDITILLAVASITGGIGWWQFMRRDIP